MRWGGRGGGTAKPRSLTRSRGAHSYDDLVRQCVKRPQNVAGAFTFGVDRKSFKTRCPTGVGTMEGFANFRARNFMLPYGDQVRARETLVRARQYRLSSHDAMAASVDGACSRPCS